MCCIILKFVILCKYAHTHTRTSTRKEPTWWKLILIASRFVFWLMSCIIWHYIMSSYVISHTHMRTCTSTPRTPTWSKLTLIASSFICVVHMIMYSLVLCEHAQTHAPTHLDLNSKIANMIEVIASWYVHLWYIMQTRTHHAHRPSPPATHTHMFTSTELHTLHTPAQTHIVTHTHNICIHLCGWRGNLTSVLLCVCSCSCVRVCACACACQMSDLNEEDSMLWDDRKQVVYLHTNKSYICIQYLNGVGTFSHTSVVKSAHKSVVTSANEDDSTHWSAHMCSQMHAHPRLPQKSRRFPRKGRVFPQILRKYASYISASDWYIRWMPSSLEFKSSPLAVIKVRTLRTCAKESWITATDSWICAKETYSLRHRDTRAYTYWLEGSGVGVLKKSLQHTYMVGVRHWCLSARFFCSALCL